MWGCGYFNTLMEMENKGRDGMGRKDGERLEKG